jgi:hypothetical protein
MDIREHNRMAWDKEVERGNKWTVPVSGAVIAAAAYERIQQLYSPLAKVNGRAIVLIPILSMVVHSERQFLL